MGSFGYQQNYGGLPEPVCFFLWNWDWRQTGENYNQEKYNTHHVNPVEDGGDVYDLDTLAIAAPQTQAEAQAEIDEKKKEDKGCKEG